MKAYNKKRKPKHHCKAKYHNWVGWNLTIRIAKAKGVYSYFTEEIEKVNRYSEIF